MSLRPEYTTGPAAGSAGSFAEGTGDAHTSPEGVLQLLAGSADATVLGCVVAALIALGVALWVWGAQPGDDRVDVRLGVKRVRRQGKKLEASAERVLSKCLSRRVPDLSDVTVERAQAECDEAARLCAEADWLRSISNLLGDFSQNAGTPGFAAALPGMAAACRKEDTRALQQMLDTLFPSRAIGPTPCADPRRSQANFTQWLDSYAFQSQMDELKDLAKGAASQQSNEARLAQYRRKGQ